MIYVSLALILWNPTPMMVVMSGSMEPTLRKGDLVFVSGRRPIDPAVGRIIVYRAGGGRRVIHRVMGSAQVGGRTLVKTRGDASLYADFEFVDGEDVVGEMVFSLPWLGYPSFFLRRVLEDIHAFL